MGQEMRYLVCVDSDGCAIDSMEIKHRTCFGPYLVSEWGLEGIESEVLDYWNEINLYSTTRGVNRFKGLAIVAERFGFEGWRDIKEWTQCTAALSNGVLAQENAAALKKALRWSLHVNQAIEELPIPQPFDGVREAIAKLAARTDLAVVSSANLSAIEKEWSEGKILEHVGVVMSQNDGSKSACIARLIEKGGYDRARVLMIGDAPGDMQAAIENDIRFYPIMPGEETQSWNLLAQCVWNEFEGGTFSTLNERRNMFTRKLRM